MGVAFGPIFQVGFGGNFSIVSGPNFQSFFGPTFAPNGKFGVDFEDNFVGHCLIHLRSIMTKYSSH